MQSAYADKALNDLCPDALVLLFLCLDACRFALGLQLRLARRFLAPLPFRLFGCLAPLFFEPGLALCLQATAFFFLCAALRLDCLLLTAQLGFLPFDFLLLAAQLGCVGLLGLPLFLQALPFLFLALLSLFFLPGLALCLDTLQLLQALLVGQDAV